MQTITIASRASELALWQATYIKNKILSLHPEINVNINKIVSRGDKILDRPLSTIGGKGHFTKELEESLLEGSSDIAVHSLKDVPTYIPKGLKLSGITKREDQRDIFLSHKYSSIEMLPKNSIIGTTSLRRRMQLLSIRKDLIIKDLRGNINTRLKKLENKEYDGIILASIGLERLNLLHNIPYKQKLPLNIMIPPMGQAALGIESIEGNSFLEELCLNLSDQNTMICSDIERKFIAIIQAGCSSPVACNATIENDIVTLEVMIGFPDGSKLLREKKSAPLNKYNNLASELAEIFKKKGSQKILKDAEKLVSKEYPIQRL